ncbi:MAG: glycoside hydrolase family 30 protein [Chitinophagaceae bacterium]|nr:glycoside hydrolase family 30 protein [Chitinophagaceae bacterium]
MRKNILTVLLLTAGCASFAQTMRMPSKVTVYTSADKSNLRISETGRLSFRPYAQPFEYEPCIFIDPANTFQSFMGIGGALTDASAETFAKLPAAQQQELLTAYFDPQKGIGYTLARTNIHSCDFSSDSYTYVSDNDKSLSSFNVAHDEKYRIPFIRKAIAAAGGSLRLFVSPWSPPAWMKDNNSLIQGGKLKPEYRQTWADYYIKFIKTYEARGIPVWGLSVQNEPMAKQRWESCIYSAEDERDFIKDYLGPTLQKQGLGNRKLIAWDHNRDLIYQRASVILNDAKAASYVWGVGFHWYETWTGGDMQFDNVRTVSRAFPDKNLIFTEGCQEKFDLDSVYNWSLGEKYGHSMINDFNSGTVAWTDWNVLLDEKGGPNHVGNFCFAPVHADTRTGKLIYTNAYYYIGHFSKFIKGGAKRIGATSNRAQLQTTAFRNPDGRIAVVVMNRGNSKVSYLLWIRGQVASVESLPHSISTLMIE